MSEMSPFAGGAFAGESGDAGASCEWCAVPGRVHHDVEVPESV
jgi:hypothetical protein